MKHASADAPVDPLASALFVTGMPARVIACTTTRDAGSFGCMSTQPAIDVMTRWTSLAEALKRQGISRLVSATQVHGAEIVRHGAGWTGTLRLQGVDGHITNAPGTALAVTVADCTPVFIAHNSGVVAALHSGWRGTAAGILDKGLDAMSALGCPANECHVHLGPSICQACYEVGPEVVEALTGTRPHAHQCIDVRAILAQQATRRGVGELTVSVQCTRHSDLFFSHRGGDDGRQLGIVALVS